MNDSQSSDLFSEASGNVHDVSAINKDSYRLLITKIKAFTNLSCNESKILLQDQFISIIEDCQTCLSQGLDIIISSLDDPCLQPNQLCVYLEDAACILQILSNLIKYVIETVAITCFTMKNFPTYTGNIILTVFKHCKDSECIYGNNLIGVGKQLKDLFRNCHELQLTYLMALEKHLIFDLTEKEEQDILIATLEINLNIGDVVQYLDVKTMAEQWKAYTMICEKYSSFLLDKNIYNNSTKNLASTIQNNIKTALETNEEDKILLRSLKVASFSLKILVRICNIFKCSMSNNYKHIVELLLHISLCIGSNYEVILKKSSEFSKLLETNLSLPIESLIVQLITDEMFLKEVFSRKTSTLKDHHFLGYILLIILIIKALLLKKHQICDIEFNIIHSVFSFLPYCHKWFNIGLKYRYILKERMTQYGLYEHLLLHTAALTTMTSTEQYKNLEIFLYEAILGTEYYSALFASNLWILLCRMGSSELHLKTLLGLLKTYEKLECHESFSTSPQRVYLGFTIEKLFKTSTKSDKLLIYKQYNIQVRKNIGVWTVLKIQALPDSVQATVTKFIVDQLIKSFNTAIKENEPNGVEQLIMNMNLASTCSFTERDLRIEDLLVKSWQKACPSCKKDLQKHLKIGYFKYIESLTRMTERYIENFERITNLIKIIQIISNILLVGNIDFIVLLFQTFFKLCRFLLDEQNNDTIEYIIANTLKNLLEMDDEIKQCIFNCIISNDNISKLSISHLGNVWNDYVDFNNKYEDSAEWQKQLEDVARSEYEHKCMELSHVSNVQEIERTKSNFDLGDIDSLFEIHTEQPAKKAKLEVDIENLVEKLETDAAQLCQFKENIFSEAHKHRIRRACEMLRNIVS